MVPSGTTTKYERSRGRCFVFNEIAGFFRRSNGRISTVFRAALPVPEVGH
jgi:hypothetical protein